MAYSVVTQPRAERDLVNAYLYIAEEAPEAATRWYRRIKAEIESLNEMPARFSLAPEAQVLSVDVRQIVVGSRSAAYRVIFRIDEGSSVVHVLAVRHGARKPIEHQDIE